MLRLRALRHWPGSHTRSADARAYFDADADGRADDVAAYAEAFDQAHARADDARADQHGRRAAAARGRARRRGCCLRRLSPYLITRRPPSPPRPLVPIPSPALVKICCGYFFFFYGGSRKSGHRQSFDLLRFFADSSLPLHRLRAGGGLALGVEGRLGLREDGLYGTDLHGRILIGPRACVQAVERAVQP